MKFRYLIKENLLEINKKVIEKHGGDYGIFSDGNLDFCVVSPSQRVYGTEIYSELHQKAASIMSNIQKLHPFLDGNKRTGFEACDVFFRINGYALNVNKEEAVSISLEIAECSMNMEQTSLWLKSHARRKLVWL